jgi:hypothetical protein
MASHFHHRIFIERFRQMVKLRLGAGVQRRAQPIELNALKCLSGQVSLQRRDRLRIWRASAQTNCKTLVDLS